MRRAWTEERGKQGQHRMRWSTIQVRTARTWRRSRPLRSQSSTRSERGEDIPQHEMPDDRGWSVQTLAGQMRLRDDEHASSLGEQD